MGEIKFDSDLTRIITCYHAHQDPKLITNQLNINIKSTGWFLPATDIVDLFIIYDTDS
jgi:hypothetical protein